jgi:hypothetical protein
MEHTLGKIGSDFGSIRLAPFPHHEGGVGSPQTTHGEHPNPLITEFPVHDFRAVHQTGHPNKQLIQTVFRSCMERRRQFKETLGKYSAAHSRRASGIMGIPWRLMPPCDTCHIFFKFF